MKLGNYTILIFIICSYSGFLFGQEGKINPKDSLATVLPSIDLDQNIKEDSIETEQIFNQSLTETGNSTSISSDSLDAPITYGAQDTQWYEHKTRTMHLFGEAYVEYENMKLTAGYIIFDMENNIASAFSIKDERGHEVQLPNFNDGEREFTYDKLRYNFKKKKGIVYDAITTESGLYVHGSKTKYVSAESDTLAEDDIIYNSNALITSCNHPEPHFGFRTKKMKVVTNKVAVMGPANLELAGVPTPIGIPFGFFPLTTGESSGFIFPEDFRYIPSQGFGVEGMGWYFPINDYMNLVLRGDLYTNGSHGLSATSNYKKLYKYNGSITLRYNNQFLEDSEGYIDRSANRSFAIGITHNQDGKAHPYRRIGGGVNFQVNGYSGTVNDDANSALNNSYNSNFKFSHSLPRTPFTFSSSFRHSQNTLRESIDVTLPDVQLRMNTVYPFKRRNASGSDEKWYEKITFKYNSEFKNFAASSDSTIFTKEVFRELRSGIGNHFDSGASFRIFKYFNISPTASYNTNWVFQTISKTAEVDTAGVASFTTNKVKGIKHYQDFDVSTSINTQLFASLPATKGWFRGYRHTIKPSASFSYAPDTRSDYEQTLIYGSGADDFRTYSPYEKSAISIPSLQDLQARINFNVGGVVEMKYYSKKDSIEKKIKLLDNLTFNGSYNMAVDSFQYSKMSLRGTSRFFKGLTTFSFGFGFDPYEETIDGRLNSLIANNPNNQYSVLRVDDAFFKLNTRFRVSQVLDFFNKRKEEEAPSDRPRSGRGDKKKDDGPISLATWIENLSIEHDVQYNIITTNGVRETDFRANTIRVSGKIPLTENWDMNIGNISYDFKNGNLVYPTFSLNRKLHCWNMRFTWAPNRGAYSFFIGVSNANLNFLKYNYGQSNIEGLINSRF